MKRLELKPDGFEMTLEECPPGFFLFEKKYVGFKSEYRTEKGGIEAYNYGGEFFWADAKTHEERANLIVTPLIHIWVDE